MHGNCAVFRCAGVNTIHCVGALLALCSSGGRRECRVKRLTLQEQQYVTTQKAYDSIEESLKSMRSLLGTWSLDHPPLVFLRLGPPDQMIAIYFGNKYLSFGFTDGVTFKHLTLKGCWEGARWISNKFCVLESISWLPLRKEKGRINKQK